MLLFSAPTINTLKLFRFQFYTNGREDFWGNHTVENAVEHTFNAPDKCKLKATAPKVSLNSLSIPGLWLFGEQDIQIPVKICTEQLNLLEAEGNAITSVCI